MSPTLEVHSIIQSQSLSHVELTAGAVLRKVELADKVSHAEKAQFLEWFNDRYEDLGEVIGSAKQVADVLSEGLSGVITPETIEIIIKIIKNI